ncbi:MAG TPA: alpha/beta hydrolase [Vicinamibacterales bacterium]|nr:alpha/beta hydrolase [Vicinamibacterales bacterium]
MITNRQQRGGELGKDAGPLTFWRTDKTGTVGKLKKLNQWEELTQAKFVGELRRSVDEEFPDLPDDENEHEHHVTLFVHGFNNAWEDALRRYMQISSAILNKPKLGTCVLFTWPSDGQKVGYYPDRKDARESADELAEVLALLYDYLAERQEAAMRSGLKTCKAKTSIIAHSMGAYVVQKAMQTVWTRKNQPLLMSLVNQLLLVGADVDNDLFGSGETVDKGDGDAIANLTYRVTALYTGLDSTLGVSAGLKHFGKRRLGRSGLDDRGAVPDNVWDADCTEIFRKAKAENIHSAYFNVPRTQELLVAILRGVDRLVLKTQFPELG